MAIVGLVRKSVENFIGDDCPTMAAALSYYTTFSLPPLLILILLLVGMFVDPQDAQDALSSQLGGLMGAQAQQQVLTIIEQADRPGESRGLAGVLGIFALLFGATGVVGQLQKTMNTVWEVEPDPEQGGIKNFVLKRVLSLGMILGIAFLLLVSLAVSAILSAFGDGLARLLPGVGETLLHVLNFGISLGVITLLFAAIFKVLPDAEVAWRDVWIGAIATGVLFVIGKFAIGFYLGQSNPGEAFGAAGSLAIVLIWVYYSAMILFFGAEFTQTWAEQRGSGIRPQEGAVRVTAEKVRVRDGEENGQMPATERAPMDRQQEGGTSRKSAAT